MEVGFEDDMDVTLMAAPMSLVICICSVALLVPTEKSFAPMSETAVIEFDARFRCPEDE